MDSALGLRSGAVTLAVYDPRWPELFVETRFELERALGGTALAVHHVGSTSVPGLVAKPLLDVLVSVANLEAARAIAPSRLASLGFELSDHDDIAERLFFRRRSNGIRTHHVSLAEPASRYHRDTLTFRDALRADARTADAYARLKQQLAVKCPRDRLAYMNGKTEFVRGVLARGNQT